VSAAGRFALTVRFVHLSGFDGLAQGDLEWLKERRVFARASTDNGQRSRRKPVYRPIYFRVLVGAVLGTLVELEILTERKETVPAWA